MSALDITTDPELWLRIHTIERQLKESRMLMAALVQSLGGEVTIPESYLLEISDADHLKVWESDTKDVIYFKVYKA